jgi:hypothetical protein
MNTDLRAELAESGRRQRAERRPVDMAEIMAVVDAASVSLDASIDSGIHPVEQEADGPRDDPLMFNSGWSVDESTAPSDRKQWIGALSAVAATILVVAGVIVVANRDTGDVVPSSAGVADPVSSPAEPGPTVTLLQDPSLLTWSRVSDDQAGVRGDGGGRMSSVVSGGPWLRSSRFGRS